MCLDNGEHYIDVAVEFEAYAGKTIEDTRIIINITSGTLTISYIFSNV